MANEASAADIDWARALVDEHDDPKDWPDSDPSVDTFRRVLDLEAVTVPRAASKESSKKAEHHKARYLWWRSIAIFSTALAPTAAALLLVSSHDGAVVEPLQTIALSLQSAAVLTAVVTGALLAVFKPRSFWLKYRAESEGDRRATFRAILGADSGDGAEDSVRLRLLRLEYMRRWLVEKQRTYYETKSGTLSATAKWTGRAVVLLTAVGAATSLAISSEVKWGDYEIPAIIGGLVPVWLAAIATFESVSGPQQQAELFEATHRALGQARIGLDELRRNPSREGLVKFGDEIDLLLGGEHTRWQAALIDEKKKDA